MGWALEKMGKYHSFHDGLAPLSIWQVMAVSVHALTYLSAYGRYLEENLNIISQLESR